jgi:microcystin-dependent protein
MSQPFIGQIALFPYDFAPVGWADCMGQLMNISQNAALFSLLGTNFGGDGVRTFALPDLRGRVAVGMGTPAGGSNYDLGEQGGVETVTLGQNQLAPHNHNLQAASARGATNAPAGAVLGRVAKGAGTNLERGQIYNTGSVNTPLVPASITATGGGQRHPNMQPALGLRYCIALNGLFPPRP